MKKFTKKRTPSLKKARNQNKKKVSEVPRMWHLAKRLQPKNVNKD